MITYCKTYSNFQHLGKELIDGENIQFATVDFTIYKLFCKPETHTIRLVKFSGSWLYQDTLTVAHSDVDRLEYELNMRNKLKQIKDKERYLSRSLNEINNF